MRIDLPKQPHLNTGCRFFFTSSRFAEPDHLCLLALHLLLHDGKYLEELFSVELGLGFRGLYSKWGNGVETRIFGVEMWTSDRLFRRSADSVASIVFPFLFGSVVVGDYNLGDTLP